jgi:hypothetical protein
MRAGRAKTERLEARCGHFGGVNLGEDGSRPSRIEAGEQVAQAGTPIVHERPQGEDLRLFLYIEDVGFDPFLGGHREAPDLAFPGGQRLERTLPAGRRIPLSQKAIGGKVVDRPRVMNPDAVRLSALCGPPAHT